MSLRDECIKVGADAIEARMGPVFGSPEYLADPVKLARAEKRRRDAAVSHATAAFTAIITVLKEPDEAMLTAGVLGLNNSGLDDVEDRDAEWCIIAALSTLEQG